MKNKADILWLESAESSNDEARKAIDSLDNLSVVAVRCQTSGRGQGTHSWESAPGENLTFSVVLKDFDISPKEQIAISQITALSVVELLSRYEVAAKIKLPNDIYVGTKKICGILIENSLCGNNLRWSIVGIGININQTVFPSHLPNPTSLLLEMPVGQNPVQSTSQVQHLELNKLLTQFHEIYSRYYDCYVSHNTNVDSTDLGNTDLGNTHESKLEALDQLFRSKLL